MDLSPPREGRKRRRGAKRSKKTSCRILPTEQKIDFPNRPDGAVSNGYEEYDVQELVIEVKVTRYLRERIVLSDGRALLAPLPEEVIPGSHFGPGLIRFITSITTATFRRGRSRSNCKTWASTSLPARSVAF
jgi:hypothetical protein